MSYFKRWFLLAGLCLLLMLITACSSKQDTYENIPVSIQHTSQITKPKKQISAIKKAAKQERMITYQATISIDTNNYSKSRNFIDKLVQQAQGYLVDSNEQQYQKQNQTGTFTYRIPQKHFHTFIQKLKQTAFDGEIRQLAINGNDVTEEMVDLEARLKAKEVTQSRLLELMKSAKDATTLLEISQQLDKVQEEIEQIEGRKQYLQNRIELAQVIVTLNKEQVVTAPDNASMWQKMKEAFWKSSIGLINVGKNLLIFLAGAIPVLVLLGLICTPVYLLVRHRKKKENKEKT